MKSIYKFIHEHKTCKDVYHKVTFTDLVKLLNESTKPAFYHKIIEQKHFGWGAASYWRVTNVMHNLTWVELSNIF